MGPIRRFPDGKGGERKEYVPRKTEELEKIKVAVKNAVGFQSARGDEVEVVEFPFDTSAMEKERVLMDEAERKAFWDSLIKPVVIAVGVLLALIFGLRPLIRSLRERRTPAFDIPGPLSMPQPGPTSIDTGPAPAPALDVASDDPLREGLMELARNNPIVVAQLVRAWMVKRPS
ncbi:MAG: hypothetical protein M5R38_10715 [Candidatus Methylomirabilis sp.]|nr:hypothetical protein [Candidatus Methylomirabilis sp.]